MTYADDGPRPDRVEAVEVILESQEFGGLDLEQGPARLTTRRFCGDMAKTIARGLSMKIAAVVSIAATLITANFVHAATISVEARGDGRPALVLIDGDLEFGDGNQFQSKTSFLSRAIVSFRSEGGNAVAGIQIGENIRLRGFTTFVARGARCASACAIAWLGGTKRFMSAESRIGFHAAYNEDGKESGLANALVGAYLNKIGLPYSAVMYITRAAPDSMTWLSAADAKGHGIDVEVFDFPRTAVAPVPVAPSGVPPMHGGIREATGGRANDWPRREGRRPAQSRPRGDVQAHNGLQRRRVEMGQV